jgi:hypothetical protein
MHFGGLAFEKGESDLKENNLEEVVHLYTFGSKYDTFYLRRHCIDALLDYLRPETLKDHESRMGINYDILNLAFDNLHESSLLLHLLSDHEIHNFSFALEEEETAKWVVSVLPSIVARRLHYYSNTRVQKKFLLRRCHYHEHASNEERKACAEYDYCDDEYRGFEEEGEEEDDEIMHLMTFSIVSLYRSFEHIS